MAGAKTSETFNCTADEFYKILIDYEKYSEFLSEVKSCKVVETKGDKKLVEFHVSVIKTFSYRLWIKEEQEKRISWEFAGGDVFKTSIGSWDLQPIGDKVKVNYAVEATFSLFVPGPIAKALVSVNLPNMMKSYHNRVKALYGK